MLFGNVFGQIAVTKGQVTHVVRRRVRLDSDYQVFTGGMNQASLEAETKYFSQV
jgi:hypothetical protein